MINIAICDDEVSVAAGIEEFLYQLGKENQILLSCDVFSDGITLLESIKQGHIYDLLYLDIEMKEMDGIKAAEEIRERELPLLIIYVSSHERYWKELLATEPFDFITKPVTKEALVKVFQKAYRRLSEKPEYFSYTYNKTVYKLPLSQITYFESANRVVYIHMAGEKQRLQSDYTSCAENKFYGKMGDIEKQLQKGKGRFLRIHQSFLVNFTYIKSMSFNEVTLMDNTVLQVSDERQKKARQQFCAMVGMEGRRGK